MKTEKPEKSESIGVVKESNRLISNCPCGRQHQIFKDDKGNPVAEIFNITGSDDDKKKNKKEGESLFDSILGAVGFGNDK